MRKKKNQKAKIMLSTIGQIAQEQNTFKRVEQRFAQKP
jgi:hypothetical protein